MHRLGFIIGIHKGDRAAVYCMPVRGKDASRNAVQLAERDLDILTRPLFAQLEPERRRILLSQRVAAIDRYSCAPSPLLV